MLILLEELLTARRKIFQVWCLNGKAGSGVKRLERLEDSNWDAMVRGPALELVLISGVVAI
jgi:hypothetical protein